jgi:hypothetical protein
LRRYIKWLGKARASLDYGVSAFIEKDANSILDFVTPERVLPLAMAVNPVDLLLPQNFQMAKYFKAGTDGFCSPCHQTHSVPSFLELKSHHTRWRVLSMLVKSSSAF